MLKTLGATAEVTGTVLDEDEFDDIVVVAALLEIDVAVGYGWIV